MAASLTDVVLPNLGFGMEEGRLLAWLKQPGDAVRKGEALAEIESDKTTVELEAVVDGTLAEILVPAGETVPVNSVLARIQTQTAALAPQLASPQPAQREESGAKGMVNASPLAQRIAREHQVDLSAISGSGPGGRITRSDVESALGRADGKPQAAPAVRKLARDQGIDLRAVRGTGPEGRIRRADVEALIQARAAREASAVTAAPLAPPAPAVPSAPPAPTAAPAALADGRRLVARSAMRRAIGARLSRSMQEAPHFYVTAELDFTAALRALPQGVGVNALILYLATQALMDFPALNATFEDGELYEYEHVHLAIAVALPDGLITPVLHRADDYSLAGLAARADDLVARARAGKLRAEELSGGTFTVSNLGMVRQVDRFTAILNPPQVGILAVGAAKARPFVIDGGLHVRTTAHLTLSADHRIIDGMAAARYLEAFDKRLQGFTG